MQLKNGKLKNINKKAIAYILAFTTIPTTLTACTNIKDVNYKRDESGYIQSIDVKLDYDFVKRLIFCKVRNKVTDKEYYTIALFKVLFYDIYDIFTMQNLSKSNIFECEFNELVENYLEACGMIKDEYTEEDLKEILNIFVENQTKEKVKVKK